MKTFTRAIEVAVDQAVTSRQARSVSAAINSRLRGFGGLPWMVSFYISNAARQVRNPDEYLWPSQGEYWEHYQHADPVRDELWPPAAPGEAQGANLSSTMMGFVHGNPAVGPEADRLWIDTAGTNALEPAALTASVIERWNIGKLQRGIYDPVSGGQNVPAFEAAQSWAQVDQLSTQVWIPHKVGEVVQLQVSGAGSQVHGLSYGGYLPQPEWLGSCGDEDETPSFQYVFTALRTGVTTNGTNPCTGQPAMIFTGSCPDWTPGHHPSHVRGILRTTHAYFVVQWNGAITELPTQDYIEGPYCAGGRLQKTHGDHIARLALNSFVKDFRGSDADRLSPGYNVEDYGFDFDRFDRAQYFLSPNLGHVEGASVVGDYPQFSWTGALQFPAGSLATYAGGGTSHTYRTGYVLGGALATATKLAGPVTIELVGPSGKVYREWVLDPDETGSAAAMTWLEDAPSPAPLSVRLRSALEFTAPDGVLTVECTEQLEYKPQAHDRYLWLRMATAGNSQFATVDGRGTDVSRPRALSDGYFASGCIVSRQPGQVVEQLTVNDNAVFDAFRRFTRDKFRVMRRHQVVGYAVEGGKSVLWFRRYSTLKQTFDLFEGIAPPPDPVLSGHLFEGEEYVVRSGSITYAGQGYAAGQRFVATADRTYTGEGAVHVYNGIRHTARPDGVPGAPSTTNQWLMTAETQLYHPAENNLWKPAAIADYFLWCQRCHVYSASISGTRNLDLRRHFNYGQSILFSPEAPSSFHYAGTANTFRYWGTADRVRFYKSCRIHEPWPEIESAVTEFEGAMELVKITFKTRFHACEPAEGGISGDLARDFAAWSRDQLDAETYRTLENGIRQYLLHVHLGAEQYNPPMKIGDIAAESFVESGNPYGSVYPHFFFLKLMPEPVADSNDTMELTDTPVVMDLAQQAETYLRGMCEAFIDGTTSADYGCRTDSTMAFDYRWENLLLQVGAGRWMGTVPAADRPKGQSGFSALPSTVLYAEVWNHLARACNALDKLRVMLPMELWYRSRAYTSVQPVTLTWESGGLGVWIGPPPAGTEAEPGEDVWYLWDLAGIGASSIAGLELAPTGWVMKTVRNVVDYKHVLADPNSAHAIPAEWRDMLETHPGFVGWRTRVEYWDEAQTVQSQALAQQCPPNSGMNYFFAGGSGYRFITRPDVTEQRTCGFFVQSTMDLGTPQAGAFYAGYTQNGRICGNNSVKAESIEPASKLGFFIVVPLEDL